MCGSTAVVRFAEATLNDILGVGAKTRVDDENAEINNLRADANTYFAENYVLFLLGDKPFSEWDSFQEQLNALGMARITEIYQEAYDEYMAA